MGFAIFRQDEVEWVPRGDDDPRTVARLSDSMTQARANLWTYPSGARGKRHADKVQEEVFVVISGRLTMLLGEPPERVDVGPGSVVAVEPGTPLQARNEGNEELLMYIYGAPPEQEGADFFDDVEL